VGAQHFGTLPALLSKKERILITAREQAALNACKRHLDIVEPHPEYVSSGKFSVGPKDNPSRGKCYIASVAMVEFLGGIKAGYHLVKGTNELGDHYWVVNNAGVVLDPTKEQFDIIGAPPPYKIGRKVGRRNNLKRHLPLIEAIQKELELEQNGVENKIPTDIFGRPLILKKESAVSDAQQEKLTLAWQALTQDWNERTEEFLRCYFPKGAMAVYFVRAMMYGEEIPRTATMAYTPERFYVPGHIHPLSGIFSGALNRPEVLRGMRFSLADEVSFTKLVSSNLPVHGYRMPVDFPISLAKKLIDTYCPVGGSVLDPCHGWGGRLVGFMLSRAGHYTGIDPAPHSYKLQEMFDDLSQYLFEEKKVKLINKPFEDTRLRDDAFDFALTSPPYYNTEKYDGEDSSWRRYKSLSEWMTGFYEPFIEGVAYALKPGAAFALQVTPKFDMVSRAKKIGAHVGLKFEKVFDTNMKRYNAVTSDKSGSGDTFEVVAIFRRR
jgi:hypothetical protein